MLNTTFKTTAIRFAAALLLTSSAGFAQAQQINLTVAPATASLPDGSSVPMWGYSCGAAVAGSTATCASLNPHSASWSPVVITVPSGPLTINLTNNLSFNGNSVPTSLVVVGQIGGGLGDPNQRTTSASPDHSSAQANVTWPIAGPAGAPGAPPKQGPRVQSFATEVATAGIAPVAPQVASGSALTWLALRPGTYLIESGTHPSIQAPMGLYGILVVTTAPIPGTPATPGTAYPGVNYSAEVPMLFSEIDPIQNSAVDAAVRTQGFSESATLSATTNVPVGALVLTNGGSGYTSAPVVTLSGGGGTGATASAQIDTDPTSATYRKVVGLTVLTAGSGYTSSPNVTISGGGGSKATASAYLSLGNARGNCNGGAAACYPPVVNYSPLYYLINGQAFDKTNPTNSLFAATAGVASGSPVTTGINATGNVLVRMVNAGLRMHVPSIVNSTTNSVPGMALVAEDGNPIPGLARVQSELFLSAGKTGDALIDVPPSTVSALPIYDRQLSLSGNSVTRDAGMLAYIGVNGSAAPKAAQSGAAQAYPDTYNSIVAGKTLIVSDLSKGVIANDFNVFGVTVTKPPTQGTLKLNTNGTFTYVANAAWSNSDSFVYCGNGATSGAACATVTLGAGAVEAASGISMGDIKFTSTVGAGATARFAMPGILANSSDGAGYPLSVDLMTVTPTSGLTVSVNADGSFAASAAAAGDYTFTFKAKNSQGTTSTNAGTATVTFPAGSGLKVAVLDGADHKTAITDYRWIIEEDRTFYTDPKCTSNPLPSTCPKTGLMNTTTGSASTAQINYGTNFHTSYMPVIAAGCTGPLSCESGQTLLGKPAVCDIGNGQCRTTAAQQTPMDPSQVALDPTKRYYISVLPGDAASPFVGGNLSAPKNCSQGAYNNDGSLNTDCGHGMGGAPIPAVCPLASVSATCANTFASATAANPITVLTVPTPLPPGKLSVFVYQDDYPLNGEQGAGGGVDVIAPNEAGLGGFQITLYDQAGGTGDATGTPTYDMFNQPLTNSLAGTIDPVTGLDACPVSPLVTDNVLNGDKTQLGIVGMIITCPKFESDGRTLSPMAGQAVINNLYPGRYSVQAIAGADRIALGEEWVQTNTLDGQKAHDAFIRVGEPGYFQEFGPAGYHVSIGFANPKIINDRRYNASKSGMCEQTSAGQPGGTTALRCIHEVKGHITGSRLSRSPDQRTYGSGDRTSLSFTQCYVALGDPDGATIAFQKCDANGNFDLTQIPPGNWELTIFDQWNDQIIDGISQAVGLACSNTLSGLCTDQSATKQTVDMGEIATHQWQADLYTRTFIDIKGTGVSDGTQPGLPLVATNIRFRDGSYSNFNNTDLNGYAGYNEVFPLFNWYVVETDATRYKTTGVHVVYDAGGPADNTSPGGLACTDPSSTSRCGNSTIAANLANTYEQNPLPYDLSLPGAVYCDDADCSTEVAAGGIAAGPKASNAKSSTGRIDPPYWFGSYGWQGFIGQGNFLEWGKKPYVAGETGGIRGHVIYASTRPFDDPQLLLQLSWEPMVPHVRINLYQEGVAADGVTPTLKLIDYTDTSSFDDWAQGFRSDGKPNISCPGQSTNDPFYYGIQDQPQYLDWYKSQHGGAAPTPLAHSSQFKCYDGNHNWNQLQPAPYDGMYNFPSVTGLDPTTGKPAGTNCTACIANPDSKDPYRAGQPMLPPGKYVVEVVVPPGYELVKEEDKNILIGDNYIAPATVQFPGLGGSVFILPDQASLAAEYNANNPQNPTNNLGRIANLPSHEGDTGSIESYWPCVGTPRQVPDYISLAPQSGEVAPFAGAIRNLCDRKEVVLTEQSSAMAKFYVFSSTHVAAHFTGIILDDFTAEFDPFSPQFGEKFAPSYLPVAMKDWTGNEINRVYSDQFGLYNGLNYSTWEVNPPNPTGYGPTMMTMCMNDAGAGVKPDPLFQAGYSQFCYELPFMPGQTGYFDTPVIPVSAFTEGYNHPDCAYQDSTPAIGSVTGDVAGPWVSAASHTLTINTLPNPGINASDVAGDQYVDWYGYSGPSITTAPFNVQKQKRHYGFGTSTGKVSIGGVDAPVTGWSDSSITVTVPANVPNCPVRQQSFYNGSQAQCGELLITTAAGKQSIDTVTVTIGGFTGTKIPTVLKAGQTIQSAIDAADPGDLIIVPAGVYNEMVVMWKPVRLQGVGAASSIIDASTQPAGKLLDPWRARIVCLFGLTADGRPRDAGDLGCASAWKDVAMGKDGSNNFTNFPTMLADRLPFEATLGWDATLNGNLAEQLSEPSLMGAYEGAVITVLGKGVKFPSGTAVADAFGAATGAAFPDNTRLLSASDCSVGRDDSKRYNPYPTNYYCNPSSIDGLGLRNSSQGGGGIFVHAYGHNLQIANNRVYNNEGTLSGGITIGQGEHPDVALAGVAATTFPTSCEANQRNPANAGLPFCFNVNLNIHNNDVSANSSEGDELFSSTPAGAGGVSINTGSDYYQFKNNWVCGNLSTGDGGGVAHIGFTKNGDIEHNTIIFNQSTNPTITTNGGGLLIMGAPDADPTTCGVATDQDCAPPPGTVLPADGTGPGLKINANLILGNAADSGSGGGLRLQHVNGTDVLNNPNGGSNRVCRADLSDCLWNSVNVTNNFIVNNVAGWDGGGVSLLDALAVNIVNNTIADNDTTASSGDLLQSIFAPLSSSASNYKACTANNGTQSCPQPAGLVSVTNSPVLMANIQLLSGPGGNPFRCVSEHGTGNGLNASCLQYSIPAILDDVIYKNRSFFIGLGGRGAGQQSQQNLVSLFNAFNGTPAATQTKTGECSSTSNVSGTPVAVTPSYWEIGVRGDSAPNVHVGGVLAPNYSILTDASDYPGHNNSASDPQFINAYCNGSRTPPEAGGSGWAVPPGTNETNGLPNPVFSLTPSAVVDEGNNWINLRWGPLSLTNPATGMLLGNYSVPGGSPAIDSGVPANGNVGLGITPPSTDFFGNQRPLGKAYDIGAVEIQATASASASLTPTSLAFGAVLRSTTSPAQTVTVTNTGNSNLAGGAFAVGAPFARPNGNAGGSCGGNLAAGATCTINLVYSPTTSTTSPSSGTLAVSYTGVTVTGSPVALSGSAVSMLVTPATLDFGSVPPGTTSAAQTLTLSNRSGATRTLIIGVTGTGFTRATNAQGGTGCGATLTNNNTCTIRVVFAPATGTAQQTPFTGSVTITTDGGVAVANAPVTLKGTAQSVVSAALSPATWSTSANKGCGLFSCPAQMFVLTNTGNVALTGVASSLAGDSEFAVFAPFTFCPATLQPGNMCIVTVRFAPPTGDASGASKAATLSISAGAAGTKTSALSGKVN